MVVENRFLSAESIEPTLGSVRVSAVASRSRSGPFKASNNMQDLSRVEDLVRSIVIGIYIYL